MFRFALYLSPIDCRQRKEFAGCLPTNVSDHNATLGTNEGSRETTKTIGLGEAGGLLIGRYQLLQKIGEGGMGEVWLAEQTEPVRRRVALKLVKAGMNTREIIARFESERQALALMNHPAIARVLDAGSTPEGGPYFVMEYVDGMPITAYCDHHRLSTRERLELFVHVCEGVQLAHQKAIIHRDLKPSNILVTEVDGKAAPKIIDFGVAKALTNKLTADIIFTRVGTMIGTPEYMSPEQALSEGEDIDTRTDIYSLGIILYELLAGAPPIDLRKVALDEFLRRLREEEPPKPSTRIRTQDVATSTEVARNRRCEPAVLAKQIRGDLDAVTLKALEKDRSRCYGSPSELAADIGRYIREETVLAVPPSAAYRARKFARRYRAALVTTCAFVLVLLLAAGISIQQSIRANREAAVAQAVSDFLQNDLLAQASAATQADSNVKPDPDLKVRTALDRAAVRITGRFDRQPAEEAAIRDTIGRTYMELGLYPQAWEQLQRALELRRRVLGPANPHTLKTMRTLGGTASFQGRYPEAETLLSQSLEIERRVLGPEHPDTLSSMSALANVYIGQTKYAQAELLDKQALDIRRRVLGAEHPDTLNSMINLGLLYSSYGKYQEAEAFNSQALEIQRRVLGAEHPNTLITMNNLANVYIRQGKYPKAEALEIQTLEIRRRVLGLEHPITLTSMSGLGYVYSKEGRYAEAEALYDQTLEIMRRILGPVHPDTLQLVINIGTNYKSQVKSEKAEALYRQTLETCRRVSGPEEPGTLKMMTYLAGAYLSLTKYEQAEALYHQTVEIQKRVLGPEHLDTLMSMHNLAVAYARQYKGASAFALLAKTLEISRRVLGPEHPLTLSLIREVPAVDHRHGR